MLRGIWDLRPCAQVLAFDNGIVSRYLFQRLPRLASSMNRHSITPLLVALALSAAHLPCAAQSAVQPQSAPAKEKEARSTSPAAGEKSERRSPAERVAESGPQAGGKKSDAPSEVDRLVREFGEQRNDLLDQRNALLERMRQAKTDEEKQKIVAELRQLQQQRIDQQREKARQIREQMLGGRETRRSP